MRKRRLRRKQRFGMFRELIGYLGIAVFFAGGFFRLDSLVVPGFIMLMAWLGMGPIYELL